MNKLDKDYIELLKDILDNGNLKNDRTGTGTLSVFGREIKHKMLNGFPMLTTRKLSLKITITELLWFMRGLTNIKDLLIDGNKIWVGDAHKKYKVRSEKNGIIPISQKEFISEILNSDLFADKWGDLGPIYGKQWRNWRGIDQLNDVIKKLKVDPDNRRIMVSAWNVSEIPIMTLPPCHYGFQIYTRKLSESEKNTLGTSSDRTISLKFNMRSADVCLGVPTNIQSYGLLLKILAKICSYIPDELICSMGDTHIYLNHIDGAKEQIKNDPYLLPEVSLLGEFDNIEKYWNGDKFELDEFLSKITYKDFELCDYVSHAKINYPLSN